MGHILKTLCNRWCRNPNLGLTTKARACKGEGQEGSSGVTSHALGSVEECEGMNPTLTNELPLWKLESQWTLKSSKNDCKGQNPLGWDVSYIIGNIFQLRCLKWVCMTHLNASNRSYSQKKGRELNWQFDSWPQKVRNHPDFLVCRWRAKYCWKDLNKGYNFSSYLISIKGLHTKLWAPKL
jgi:hypothetical protein